MRASALWVGALALLASGCEPPDPALIPDELLQRELGLTEDDRVHTVELRTGVGERSDPQEVVIRPGDLVQFVSSDWFVHEVHFAADSMEAEAFAFLEANGQSASPPLIHEGGRFVLSFAGAPPGRYVYILEGNRSSGSGSIVVFDENES